MQESSNPRQVVRRFSSHEEQEEEDFRYWSTQPLSAKIDAVAEMAKHFATMHHIDIDAQGPKRFVARAQRA
jgi:hypothetical protein